MGNPLKESSKSYAGPLHERGRDSLLVWAEKAWVSLANSSLFSKRSSFTFVQKQFWERSSATNCGYKQGVNSYQGEPILSTLENWWRCERWLAGYQHCPTGARTNLRYRQQLCSSCWNQAMALLDASAKYLLMIIQVILRILLLTLNPLVLEALRLIPHLVLHYIFSQQSG